MKAINYLFLPIKRWGLLCVLIAFISTFFYFHLYHYLSFEVLKEHREQLLLWANSHFIQASLGFMGIYILMVAASIPGAVILTLAAGFLFGAILGTLYVVISASVGAFILFISVELALREWILNRATPWMRRMERGFKYNAFSYLIFLRLVPLFPFWVVNIVPALLGVSRQIFFTATFIGIIPGAFVYTSVGSGLGHAFDTSEVANFAMITDPFVLLPIMALAVLSLLPVGYRYLKKNSSTKR